MERYAWVCRDRDKFERDIEDAGETLETEESLLVVGAGWDAGWGFRLNANFVLGTLEALKDSTAFSRLFNCCESCQLLDCSLMSICPQLTISNCFWS